jgi:hypothetical protein
MSGRGHRITSQCRVWLLPLVMGALLTGCHPDPTAWFQQTRWMAHYWMATGDREEPLGFVERLSLAYLRANAACLKAKRAGEAPAPSAL